MTNNKAFQHNISKVEQGNFPANFKTYYDEAGDADLNTLFKEQQAEADKLFNSISEEVSETKYGEDKWTIKEVLQHIIDAERVFAYRALALQEKILIRLLPLVKMIMLQIVLPIKGVGKGW